MSIRDVSINAKKNPLGSWANLAESEAKALEAMWQTRQSWLEGQIAELGEWYDRLGWIGHAFKRAFQDAACIEEIDTIEPELGENTRAVMNGHNVYRGFMNGIIIGRAALTDENPYALFSALNHERTHLAVQYRNVAAAHATPWNSKAYVILCPRDAMILNVLMERQAFAAQRVLEDLAKGIDAGELGPHNMPTRQDMQSALQAYTRSIDWHTKWGTDDAFVRHYRKQAQSFYEGSHATYLKRSDVTYARLGLEDLRAMNDFLGLNTFGDTDDELLALLHDSFEEYQLDRLAAQNDDLGVGPYASLPTITEALARRGMKPLEFIRKSLAGCPTGGPGGTAEQENPLPDPCDPSLHSPAGRGLASDPAPEYV